MQGKSVFFQKMLLRDSDIDSVERRILAASASFQPGPGGQVGQGIHIVLLYNMFSQMGEDQTIEIVAAQMSIAMGSQTSKTTPRPDDGNVKSAAARS
jgi:hypothetical protein